MRDVVIIGASDVFDLVETSLSPESFRIVGYLGPAPLTESVYPCYRHLGTDQLIRSEDFRDAAFVVAVYDNRRRREMVTELLSLGREVLSLKHPSAVVYPSASLGVGSLVAPQAVISTNAQVGMGVYVNYAALVGHDVVVEDFGFVSPGARLLGRAKIGSEALIGTNAVVSMRVSVGSGAQIAAGLVVTRDVPDGTVVMGQQKQRRLFDPVEGRTGGQAD